MGQQQHVQVEKQAAPAPIKVASDAAALAPVLDPVTVALPSNEAEDEDDVIEDPYAVPPADPYVEGSTTAAATAADSAAEAASASAAQAAAVKRVAGALARAADKLPAD